jgi:drug/metabolite transporter (DMT)-like permease
MGVVFAGLLWGLFWLPMRWLGEMGLEGAWPGAFVYAASFVLLLPVIPLRWANLRRFWRPLALVGLFTGAAFACYSTSFLLTDVVRTILLFYLTPVWSTILGFLLLGERLTLARALALVLGIVGLLVVFGLGVQFPWPRNLGDWLALVSGMFWAYGSLKLYRMGTVAIMEQTLCFVAGAFVMTILGIIVIGPAVGPAPVVGVLWNVFPVAALAGLYVVPMLVLTVWPATVLSPGRVGILLMSEVVVGVGSAALLTGEPFGSRELLGAVLIVSAAAVELFGRVRKSPGVMSP